MGVERFQIYFRANFRKIPADVLQKITEKESVELFSL